MPGGFNYPSVTTTAPAGVGSMMAALCASRFFNWSTMDHLNTRR